MSPLVEKYDVVSTRDEFWGRIGPKGRVREQRICKYEPGARSRRGESEGDRMQIEQCGIGRIGIGDWDRVLRDLSLEFWEPPTPITGVK